MNPTDDTFLAETFATDVDFCPHCGAVVDQDGISIEEHACEWCRETAG